MTLDSKRVLQVGGNLVNFPDGVKMPLVMLTFMLMGRPWNGPEVTPVALNCASSSLARAIASSKNISVKQDVCSLSQRGILAVAVFHDSLIAAQ